VPRHQEWTGDRLNTTRQRLLWIIPVAAVIIGALLPVVWILSLSLKEPVSIGDGSFIPNAWTFDNYRAIADNDTFTRALLNSIGIAVISTAISVTLATSAAYAVARLRFKGKRAFVGAALAISMFPQAAMISPIFQTWREVGLFDTWPGLVLPYLTFSLPLAIYTLSSFFKDIPWDLESAAAVDGATPFQSFRYVIAPLATPAVFTTAILVFIFCWNDFVFAASLTSTDASRTVPAALAFFTGGNQFTQPYGTISAAAVVVTIPIVIMVVAFQRKIVAGLTAGAVKG
jgi:multiple sugar transport system permease protein